MWDALQFILLIGAYILITYLIVKLITKLVADVNPFLRLLILSFFYALFWGISIAATGGDPGFGFPAPNIVAIVLMLSIGFFSGVVTGLYLFSFWWAAIFAVMFVRYLIRKKITPTKQ